MIRSGLKASLIWDPNQSQNRNQTTRTKPEPNEPEPTELRPPVFNKSSYSTSFESANENDVIVIESVNGFDITNPLIYCL